MRVETAVLGMNRMVFARLKGKLERYSEALGKLLIGDFVVERVRCGGGFECCGLTKMMNTVGVECRFVGGNIFDDREAMMRGLM